MPKEAGIECAKPLYKKDSFCSDANLFYAVWGKEAKLMSLLLNPLMGLKLTLKQMWFLVKLVKESGESAKLLTTEEQIKQYLSASVPLMQSGKFYGLDPNRTVKLFPDA